MTILPPSCNDLRRNWTSEITIMEKLKSTVTFGNGIEVSCKVSNYISYITFLSPLI